MSNVFMNFSKYAMGIVALLAVMLITAQTQAISAGDVEWPPGVYFDFLRALAAFLG